MSVTLDYLCTLETEEDIEESLESLPPDLVDSYEELFRQKTQRMRRVLRKRLDVALSFLLLSVRPSADAFVRILRWHDDPNESDNEDLDVNVAKGREAVVQLCFNLVIFDNNIGVFRFAHTSVQEYLLKHQKNSYGSADVNYGRVAEHCLSILLRVPDHFCDNTKRITDDTFLSSRKFEQPEQTTQGKNHKQIAPGAWYFQLPAKPTRTLREDAVFWMRWMWAYLVLNSGECRQFSPLRELENQFQGMAAKQPFESLRPLILFSACQFGLKPFVETCVRAHPEVVLIHQLPACGSHSIATPFARTMNPKKEQEKLRPTAPDDGLYGATLLHRACAGGHTEIVQFLIENGAIVDQYTQGSPKTNALCIAIRKGHEAVARLLLRKGADPNIDSGSDVQYPMHYILSEWKTGVPILLQNLIEHGADIDAEDNHGVTAIGRAVIADNLDAVTLLLERGAKRTLSLRQKGVTSILHWASRISTTPERSLAMTRIMVEHGMDVNFRGMKDDTPLLTAVLNKNPGVADFLLNVGACVNVRNVFGATPLVEAISIMRNAQSNASRLLSTPGPTGTPNEANESNRPVDFVAWFRPDEKLIRIFEMLIAAGADVNSADVFCNTALQIAARKGLYDVAKSLIEFDAQVNASDALGHTALHEAV